MTNPILFINTHKMIFAEPVSSLRAYKLTLQVMLMTSDILHTDRKSVHDVDSTWHCMACIC